MKLKLFSLTIIAAAVVLCAQPKMFIEQKTFNFGTVSEGDRVPHSFAISNKGTEPLRITAVRVSCGCTAAEFDSVIAPGQTGKVSAEFNTRGFTGQQEKIVHVHSNDPDSARIGLHIAGFVITPLELTPRWLSLQSDNGKVKAPVTFSTSQKAFSIKKAQFVFGNSEENRTPIPVRTTLRKKNDADKNGLTVYEYDFEFSINTDKNEVGRVVFDTSVKQKPTVELHLSIEQSTAIIY